MTTRLRSRNQSAFLVAVIAVAALALGVIVYMSDRPVGTAYWLPSAASFYGADSRSFGPLGDQLPDFVHVFSFVLLTAAVLPPSQSVLRICAFWWTLDTLFEIGQHVALRPRIAAAVPGWFQDVPILENTKSYFLRGTFDPLDIGAISAGCVAAYVAVRLVYSGYKPSTLRF